MTKRVVFHIDANSAFLSWTAAHKVLILHHTGQERPGQEIRHSHRGAPVSGSGEMPQSHGGGAGLWPVRGVLPAHGGAAAPGGPGSGAIFH